MYFNKPHKSVVIGDDRKATREILESQLAKWDRWIADWKPPTPWEAANQRQLKRFKENRTAILKAMARMDEREKDQEKEDRRNVRVVESADTQDSESCAARRGGSTPLSDTDS